MRVLSLSIALLGLAACSSGGPDGTGDDDTNDVIDDGTHPLVPDEFKLLWNTSGECSTEFGDGDQMYMIFEGEVDEAGNLSGTERVWWFFADKPVEDDCMDTFELSGATVPGEPEALGCSSCEEFYQTPRTLTEDSCGARYDRVYRSNDDGLYQLLMIDTVNEFNGQPNEDNKIGVFHEEKNFFGQGYVTKLYAAETGSLLEPDTENYGPPGSYKWIGKRCQVKFRGGG